jgi:ferritin-like metal-binding protein YciE
MGLFSKDIKNMDDLFVHTLRDIYYAEKQIVKALPDMVDKASDPQFKQGFQTHLRETENHVKRLEQVFQLTGKKAQGVDCPGD